MTATYSGDPSSSAKDEIRFLLQDTDMTDALLQDEEISYFVSLLSTVYGNNIATAAHLADIVANKFAREVSISADGVSIGAQELQDKYRDMAKQLRYQWHQIAGAGGAPDVGGILWGESIDPTIKPLEFGIGFTDNYRAGQQEYGGNAPTDWPGWRDEYYWGAW